MTRTISTPAELDALPFKSVVLDAHGRAFQKFRFGWEATGLTGAHDRVATPATVLRDPSTPPAPAPDPDEDIARCCTGDASQDDGHHKSCRYVHGDLRPDPDDREKLGRLLWELRGGSISGAVSWGDPKLFTESVKESWREQADAILAAGFRRLTVTPETIEAGAKEIWRRYVGPSLSGFDKPLYAHDREKALETIRAVLVAVLGGTK